MKPFQLASSRPSVSLSPRQTVHLKTSIPAASAFSTKRNSYFAFKPLIEYSNTEPDAITDQVQLSAPFERGQKKNDTMRMSVFAQTIPADLINVINNHSDRMATVKIFKHKIIAAKALQDKSIPMAATKKTTVDNQIKKGDSVQTIKFLVDRGAKQYERQKKDKLKGSMFVNDLWATEYEKVILRATKINKELFNEDIKSVKPLDQKFEELNRLYHKMNVYSKETEEVLEDFQSARRFSIRPDDLFAIDKQNESLRPISPDQDLKLLSLGRRSRSKFEGRPSIFASKTIAGTEKLVVPCITDNINLDLRTDMKSQEFISPRKRPLLTVQVKTMNKTNITPLKFDAMSDTNHSNSARTLNKPSPNATPLSAKSCFGTENQAWLKPKASLFAQDARGSFLSARAVTSSDDDTPSSLTKKKTLPSPSLMSRYSEKRNYKKDFKSESNEAFEGLIERCKTEIDDKDECIGMMENLKQVFKNSRFSVKKKVVDQKKDRTIEEFRFMLEKREAKKKGA